MDTSAAIANLPPWFQAALLWFQHQQFLTALIIMIPMDFASGVMLACVTKKVSSTTAWRGMCRKVMTLMIVGLAAILQPIAGLPLLNMVCLGYIATEGLSILENAVAIGVPVPQALVDVLEKLRQDKASRYAPVSQPIAPVVVVQASAPTETPKP